LRGQGCHLLFKGDAVVFGFFRANVAPGHQDVVIGAHFVQRGSLTEARHISIFASFPAPGVIGAGDFGDILIRECSVAPGNHGPKLTGIDEQDFVGAVAEIKAGVNPARTTVARQEPQAGWDHGVVEELGWESDHAVHDASFDHVFADLPFAAGVAVHAAIRQNDAGSAGWAEFVGEVLQPGVIGVANRRYAILPSDIIAQLFSAPVADVEGRISQHKICFQVRVAVIQEGIA